MPDALMMLFSILASFLSLAIIGQAIYGVVVWRRRPSQPQVEANPDPDIGAIPRLYFYIVALVSILIAAIGITLALQFIFGSASGAPELSRSTTSLVLGMSLVAAIGSPFWLFDWRIMLLAAPDIPVETQITIRKLYIFASFATGSGGILYNSANFLQWMQ